MPIISVQVAAAPDDELAGRLAETVTTLTAEILGKDPGLTAVAVDFVPRRHWFLARKPVEERGPSAFFLTTRVAAGTNTKDEKARYAAEVFAALGRLLGGVNEESYILVDDAPADSYGYGGLTQERRYIEARARKSG